MVPTREEFLKYVQYNPKTGDLIWVMQRRRIRIGTRAGTIRYDGYLDIEVKDQKYKAHRLAFFLMTGYWPKEIDHINRNRADNRWCNLREVTKSENGRNRTGWANKSLKAG